MSARTTHGETRRSSSFTISQPEQGSFDFFSLHLSLIPSKQRSAGVYATTAINGEAPLNYCLLSFPHKNSHGVQMGKWELKHHTSSKSKHELTILARFECAFSATSSLLCFFDNYFMLMHTSASSKEKAGDSG
jgi:hypothetical protein